MCDEIQHRGPDSRGIFVDPSVGIGVQRLAVIDLHTGNQPVGNEDDSVIVVLNGEIYNYRELRRDLEKSGHQLRTEGDTEVIAHLYEDFGADLVQRLRGMFAFAVWDRRRRLLLLARDRLGKKPLYYCYRRGTLWFGSEAKAILQDPAVPRDVDLHAVDAFLHYQYVPEPRSAFAALRRIPPGHTLTWRDGEMLVTRYWKLSYRKQDLGPESELPERLRDSLLEATQLRLRSDVPVGAFLSGGIDSSAVVAAMARTSSGSVRTFSIGFVESRYDETRYARDVARRYSTEHEELIVEPSALELLPRLAWHYGEPFADPSAIPSFYLASLARSQVTVALTGDGGDEAFAGYPRHYAMQLLDLLARVPTPATRFAGSLSKRIGPGGRQGSSRYRLHRLAPAIHLQPVERYANWVAFFAETERRALYTSELRSSVAEGAALEVIRSPWFSSDADNAVDRLLDVDVQTYLPGALLVKMDIASMAHSLEVRSPLLDHEFMEFAARLPAHLKLDGRRGKRIFKEAMRPWLPDTVIDRPKQGFRVPLADWFRGPLRGLPEEVLLDPISTARGYFRPEQVRALIASHHDKRADNAERLWALIQLELWHRMWVDRVPGATGVSTESATPVSRDVRP